MSYEGYDQVLCEKGHLTEFDCHDEEWQFHPVCHCGAKFVWSNPVNQTNGSFDEDDPNIRIDGYVELEVLQDGERCPHCKSKIEEVIFKIPQGKGHPVIQRELLPCPLCGSTDPCECWDTICKGCGEYSPICDCDREESCGCSCPTCSSHNEDEEEEFGIGLTDEELDTAHRATPEETEKYRKAIEEKTGEPRAPRKSRDEEEFGAGL